MRFRPHVCAVLAAALAPTLHAGPDFNTTHIVENAPGDQPSATFPAYIDGDEHLDIVCAFFDSGSIVWYRNGGQPRPQFTKIVIDTGLDQAYDVFAVDMDGDGDTDIVAVGAGSNTGTLRWYENNGGYTPSFTARNIATGLANPLSVVAVDLDKDGDVDIVITLANGDDVRWFENDGASPPSFTAHNINTGVSIPSFVVPIDVNADGHIDLVFKGEWDEDLYTLLNDGNSPPGFSLTAGSFEYNASAVCVADVDGDGDDDLVAVSFTHSTVWWFENVGFHFLIPHEIGASFPNGISIFAADLDGDGDVDVAVGRDFFAATWFEQDGQNWNRHNLDLGDPTMTLTDLFIADVDGDHDPDLLSVGDESVRWHESGLFGFVALPEEAVRNLISGAVYPAPHQLGEALADAHAGDDLIARSDTFIFPPGNIALGLGNPDSLIALGSIPPAAPDATYSLWNAELAAVATDYVDYPRYARFGAALIPVGRRIMYREQGGMNLQCQVSLNEDSTLAADSAIDMGRDSSLTIPRLGHAKVRAPGGLSIEGGFDIASDALLDVTGPLTLAGAPVFTTNIIAEGINFATSVAAGDVNGDGTIDILSTSQGDNAVYWHENDGAQPPAFTTRLVNNQAGGARSVSAADFDGDGDLDVLAVAEFQDAVRWYRNNGETPPQFEVRTVFASSGDNPLHAIATDLDGDGDADVLSAWSVGGIIRWHENDGADPPSFTTHTVFSGAAGANSVFAADLDGDGDLDVISTSEFDSSVRWFQNNGGSPPTFTERVITSSAAGPRSVHAADFNGDGRTDIVVANGDDNSIRWFRNEGGSPPVFTEFPTPAPGLLPVWVRAADVDGDGDADVVYACMVDGAVRWLENDGDALFLPHDIDTVVPAANCVATADIDGDGLLDVLSSSYSGHAIRWHDSTHGEHTLIDSDSFLLATHDVRLARSVMLNGSVIGTGFLGDVTNAGVLTGSGTLAADTTNDALVTLLASMQVIGDYTNNHTTVIESGTLTVLGAFTNNGTILGDSDRATGGLAAQGDFRASAGASLVFPTGGTIALAGDFDAAIDSNARFDLSVSTLKLHALAQHGPQAVEVMSVNIGPDELGLDRTMPGHYPLGAFRVGPTSTTVNLVDNHDNANDGQGEGEAIYATDVIIEAGARLNTNGFKVYYKTLVLDGSVDDPANLVEILPPCPADFNGDGAVNTLDVLAFLNAYTSGDPRADFNGDTVINTLDVLAFLNAYTAGCP